MESKEICTIYSLYINFRHYSLTMHFAIPSERANSFDDRKYAKFKMYGFRVGKNCGHRNRKLCIFPVCFAATPRPNACLTSKVLMKNFV